MWLDVVVCATFTEKPFALRLFPGISSPRMEKPILTTVSTTVHFLAIQLVTTTRGQQEGDRIVMTPLVFFFFCNELS